eukprot:IDg1128t1
MDPANIAALKDLSIPETAGELSQFVFCMRWMSGCIPQFTQRASLLTDLLEKAFKNPESGRKDAVNLAFPDKEKRICVFTDASEQYWSAVVTQCYPSDLKKPLELQKHEPLAFLGAKFKNAKVHWTMFEKEAYAIYQTFRKLDYLFYDDQSAHVFTDHRNLLFAFAPLFVVPGLKKHTVGKVLRWAMTLSKFPYTIEHIDGNRNIFADILTRWLRGYRIEKSQLRISKLAIVKDIVQSSSMESFCWPEMAHFKKSQDSYLPKEGTDALKKRGEIWFKNDAIYIPCEDLELQMKILVSGHTGIGGHRGKRATESAIRENFFWKDMATDIDLFVRHCIHCVVSRTGETIPRPLGSALHGQYPNDVLHCDYLYVGPGCHATSTS